MLNSLKDILKVTQVLKPQTLTDSASSAGVETSHAGSLSFAVNTGSFAFSGSNKLDIVMQHADVDTDGSYANCADDDIFNAEDGANGIVKSLDATSDQDMVHLAHYRGNKKFARIRLVETGTVSCIVGVVAVQGDLELNPPL